MSNSYDTHTFLASDGWSDFAGDLVHSPTLSPFLATNSVGASLKLESCPSAVNSPLSELTSESLPPPQTPEDLAQADLSIPAQQCKIVGPQRTNIDSPHAHPLPPQDHNIKLEELTHLAKAVPAGSPLDLMAIDSVVDSSPRQELASGPKHKQTSVRVEEAEMDPQHYEK